MLLRFCETSGPPSHPLRLFLQTQQSTHVGWKCRHKSVCSWLGTLTCFLLVFRYWLLLWPSSLGKMRKRNRTVTRNPRWVECRALELSVPHVLLHWVQSVRPLDAEFVGSVTSVLSEFCRAEASVQNICSLFLLLISKTDWNVAQVHSPLVCALSCFYLFTYNLRGREDADSFGVVPTSQT